VSKDSIFSLTTCLLLEFDAELLFLIELIVLIAEENRPLYKIFVNKSCAGFGISINDIPILSNNAISSSLNLEVDSD